ncbi:sigma-54-dependent transcriptional regulator [Brevundimonas naejangsanensis]|uniref:sigma-54-dependent transcriptional regulator n=1 Tax=Brevundimonas naejangsanensis TaxID=588932 RepID=UPI000400B30B|nr:sigma-54 dependent transcriptional regulator [Brevundimonas naejangsanensis]
MTTPETPPSVLFIEDDAELRRAIVDALDLESIIVQALPDAVQALAALTPQFRGVVVSDIRMPGMDGLELFSRIRALDSQIPVILISGHADVPMAVQALQDGAFDFLTKPFAMERLITAVNQAQDYRTRALAHRSLRAATEAAAHANTLLIGESPAMVALREAIARIAASDLDVLVEGETGTGKELAALTLHRLSKRRGKSFVPVNCGAIPDDFAEVELFGQTLDGSGYRRTAQVGRIEAADKGTLFLDEIDSMSPGVQVKLLRVLEERTLMSGGEPYPVDIRVIAASKRDLESAAREGAFRSDLFYRLNVVRLRMPPLRERREDILPLFAHFLADRKQARETDAYAISDPIRQHLLEHSWPGNVRELRNFALSTLVNVPEIETAAASSPQSLTHRMDAFEAALIREALQAAGGNVSEVIARLGTPRKTLYGKFKRLNIDPAAYR